MKIFSVAMVLLAISISGCQALKVSSDNPPEYGVYFAFLEDGDAVSSEVKVKMRVNGMTVQPAGEIVPKTGHFHLIVDSDPIPRGEVIPKSLKHMHYGKGQTEAMLRLPTGTHTITLQFGNGRHIAYGDGMTQTITVRVK